MSIRTEIRRNRIRLNRCLAKRNILNKKCWFVDIPRTSSSSIRVEMGRLFGIGYGKENEGDSFFSQQPAFDYHLTAIEAKRELGDRFWQQAFTFSFVRNPWARFLSLYFFRKSINELPDECSFSDYVRQLNSPWYNGENSLHSYQAYYYSMSEYLLDKQGNLLVDFVGKYENRERDLSQVAQRLGVEFSGIRLQVAHASNSDYSKYYNDETKSIISRVYQKDIELFGYEF
jgi:hypothetical protein